LGTKNPLIRCWELKPLNIKFGTKKTLYTPLGTKTTSFTVGN
jgi:hypothetical protein